MLNEKFLLWRSTVDFFLAKIFLVEILDLWDRRRRRTGTL